jgi:cytochrome c oxidase cbb3-type subunit 4
MDWGLYHSIATVAAFISFIGVCWWAYSPKNKKRFQQDAQLVFDDPAESDQQDQDDQPTGDRHS